MSNTAISDKRIYLDHAATAPTSPEVLKKMLPYFDAQYGNPSSLYGSGLRARRAISEAREQVAEILGAQPGEILFTGSGTESDNLAVLGAARANRMHGNHIIISAIEHKAVLESALLLQKEGYEVTVLPVDSAGKISINECVKNIKDTTTLISVMYANNEIGTIEPISELSAAIKKWRGSRRFPLFHTDACQAAGFLDLNTDRLGIDLLTINGSKIYGPKGIGVLYVKRGLFIQPIIVGGEQERGLRAGTESVPTIVGFAEALNIAEMMRGSESKRLAELRDWFIHGLIEKVPGAIVNGHLSDRLPNNVHISIPYVEGESMLLMLDELGVEASTGSACSASDLQPSHVLMAIGQHLDLVHGSIRFSLGRETTKEKLEYVLSIFPSIVRTLTDISALTYTAYEK